MQIIICPIKRLYQILAENHSGRCAAIISSSGPIEETKLRGIPHVFRCYEDLDYESGRAFSREDAAAFAAFFQEWRGRIDVLYCCCNAGQSRSPAVAAALTRSLGADDLPLWANPQYHPNMLVYEMLTTELAVPLSDQEIDRRMFINQQAFRNAIRGGNH